MVLQASTNVLWTAEKKKPTDSQFHKCIQRRRWKNDFSSIQIEKGFAKITCNSTLSAFQNFFNFLILQG